MIILKQTNHWILLSLIWILTVISMAEPYAFARTKRPQGTRRDTLSSSCLEILAITPRIHKSQYRFSDFEFHQMSQLLDQYKIFLQAFKDPKFSGNQISAYFLPILDFHYGLTKHLVQGGQTDSFTHPIFFEHFKTMLRKLKELKSRLPPPNAEIEPFLSIKPPSTPSDVQLTDFLNHSEILDLLILNMESLIKRPSKINYKKVNSFFLDLYTS
ncbi:MAG: hypothetical protein K1X29_07630 [Bdellovibrionales bacterium]|nr:hypothetical protein [Bdellovibrionales bacterium]